MNIKLLKYYIVIVCIVFTSCNSYKKIPYFQNLDLSSPIKENIDNYTALKVQKDDILGIQVSSLNKQAASVFNSKLDRANGNPDDVSPNNPVNPNDGYLVDDNGEIQFPVLGNIKVLGLTTAEIKEQLKIRLAPYLKDVSVNIRIINFKISILGDVLRPNIYPVQTERITVLEALSLAGDLNITAKRKNVLLIREQDGKREYIPIDLNSKDLFKSSYYYLKSNDVIYVESDRTKYASVDIGYRNATLIIAALSVVVIAFSTAYR